MRSLKLILPATAFVLGALVAYAVASGAQPAPQTDPAPASASEPIGVVLPFTFQGDAQAAAQEWIGADQSRREDASEEGTTLETYDIYGAPSGNSSSGPEGVAPSAPPEPGETPAGASPGDLPAAPRDESGTAEAVVDLCAGDPRPDYCPDGVGGTILFTLDTPPPFDGMISLNPYHPGTAPFPYYPECAPVDLEPGSVQVGISVNRPANIDLLFSADTASGTVTHSPTASTEAHDAAWLEWFDSADATASDPDQWITLCEVVEGLQAGTWQVQASFSDAADSDRQIEYPRDVPLTLRIDDAPDELVQQVRRPTSVVPLNVDRVLVNATLPSDQWLTMRAVPLTDGGREAACLPDYWSTEGSLAAGLNHGFPLTQSEIPAATRSARDYPYLPDHDIAQTHEFFLDEGTDYLLCLYWMDGRGSPTDARPVEIEAIPVSVPEAYRVDVEVLDIHDTWGALNGTDVEQVAVHASHPHGGRTGSCDRLVTVDYGAGLALWSDERTLCEQLAGADGLIRHGLSVVSEIDGLEGTSYFERSVVRVDPRCGPAGCVPRSSEMAIVPLADVPAERRMCGSGFGGSCSSDVPMRSAGEASVLITYTHTEGNGLSRFRIGEPRSGGTGPGTPDEPYVEIVRVDTGQRIGSAARDGVEVGLDVTFHNVEPGRALVRLTPAMPGDEFCAVNPGVAGFDRYVTVEAPGTPVRVTVPGLCAGADYRVLVFPFAGSQLPIWPESGWELEPWRELSVAPLEIAVHGRVLAAANENYSPYSQTGYGGIAVASAHTSGGHASPLDHAVDDELVESLAGSGWVYDDRRYSACGLRDRSTHFQRTFHDTVWLSHGAPLRVEGNAVFRRNEYNEDAREWTCNPLPTRGGRGTPVNLEVSAVVTIDELLDGVVIETTDEEDGNLLRVELRAS